MASLNQIADGLTLELKRPEDTILRDLIKDLIKQQRALYLRQSIDKYGVDLQYIQRYRAELIKVDKADTCLVTVGCAIHRTENKVPTPVRYNCDVPFQFVGSVDEGITFVYTPMSGWKHTSYNKYTANIVRYDYIDNYIYLFNTRRLKYISIRAIYENPSLIIPCMNDDIVGICYTDDMEFPIPEDLLTIIRQNILKEFGVIKPEDTEVKIVDENSGK
jgi:hypothetical protein